jgi:hypothetical protein
MVQVDVFWSYGIGAGFAVANTLKLEAEQQAGRSAYDHTSFRDALLYLGSLFVPSGAFLIWQFTSWETMHVASYEDIPGWLMAAFTITNFTQGILGFAVAAMFLRRRNQYAAYLQWLAGHFGLLFILVHGWDGTGYMRFFSTSRAELAGWTWWTALRWFTSDVFLSLLTMGVVMLPVMFGVMARDLKRGYPLLGAARSPQAARAGMIALAVWMFLALIPGVLAAAILSSVAIRYLGAIPGTVAAAAIIYAIGLRPGGLFHRHFRRVVHGDPFLARPVEGVAYAKEGPAVPHSASRR